MMRPILAVLSLVWLLAGCAQPGPIPCEAYNGSSQIYVMSHGWHSEIGLPTAGLSGPMVYFKNLFPGARTLLFGYGKRSYMTGQAGEIGEVLAGPLPGEALIEVIGLTGTPQQSYDPRKVLSLPAGPDNEARAAAFIWADVARDAQGAPVLVGPGHFTGSLFFAARSRYSLAHTCNGWIADALHAAGLAVDPRGVVFSGQVMGRAAALCPRYHAGLK